MDAAHRSGLPTGSLGRIGLDVYRKNGNIVYAIDRRPAARSGVAPDGASAGGGGGVEARGGRRRRRAAGDGATGLYRSDDGGATWQQVSSDNPRPMYFSQMRVDPNNPDRVYMGGVGLQMTIDGGKTFETDAALVVHDDIHAIWIDPNNSDHVHDRQRRRRRTCRAT